MGLPEQLFLDLPIADVLDKDHWLPVVEPWASAYVNAISDRRFGDAIWARYHIFGEVKDGILNNKTVLEAIEEDALSYRRGEPDIYLEALLFYKGRSSTDGHAEIIEMLVRIDREYSSHACI